MDPAECGDVYTFVALDAVTKLLIAYYVASATRQPPTPSPRICARRPLRPPS
jgi:hypothetical protein